MQEQKSSNDNFEILNDVDCANKLGIQKMVHNDLTELNDLMSFHLQTKKNYCQRTREVVDIEYLVINNMPTMDCTSYTIHWLIEFVMKNIINMSEITINWKKISENYVNKTKEYITLLEEADQWDPDMRFSNKNSINYAKLIFERNIKYFEDDVKWKNDKIVQIVNRIEEEKKNNESQKDTFTQMIKTLNEITQSFTENTESSNNEDEDERNEVIETLCESLKDELLNYVTHVRSYLDENLSQSEDELKEWNLKMSEQNKENNKLIYKEFPDFTLEKLHTIMNYFDKNDIVNYELVEKFGLEIVKTIETTN